MQMTVSVAMTLNLKLRGGLTRTIFPEIEAWLEADIDRRRALEYVAARKKMDRYRSVIDFVFCEIYSEYQGLCFKFYANSGRLLKHDISVSQREEYVRGMLYGLQQAYDWFKAKRRVSWTQLRAEVRTRRAA